MSAPSGPHGAQTVSHAAGPVPGAGGTTCRGAELISELAARSGLADHTTVTLVSRGPAVTPESPRHTVGGLADDLQRRYGEGPGLTASQERLTVVVADLRTEQRWPEWTPSAVSIGVGSVLSMPFTDRNTTGSLNFWSSLARLFGADDVERARILTALTASLIAAADRQENLLRAVEGRTVIGQAQGILIERYRVTPAAAFSALSTYSQLHNRKVSSIAEQLVFSGELPELHPPAASG